MVLINEGLSSRLFHFCPLSALYQIVEFDSFKLTPSDARPSDREMTSLPVGNGEKKYFPYYMCFSRTPSSLAGYVAMRRASGNQRNWAQTLVRIEVDGDLLSRYYKGMPVNYFNDKNLRKINHYYEYRKEINPETGKPEKVKYNTVKGRYGAEYAKRMTVNALNSRGNIVSKDIRRYTPHMDDPESPQGKPRSKVAVDYGVLDRNQMHEYEDRLFSYAPWIRNAHKYIKRIDIYVTPSIISGSIDYAPDALRMLREIVSTPYGKIIHIYTNQADFESFGKANKVGEIDFEQLGQNNKEETPLAGSEISTITRYAVILSFCGVTYPDWKDRTRQRTWELLSQIGMNEGNMRNILERIIEKYLSNIETLGKRFFSVQTKTLKKELEGLAPYKRKKYIEPLQKIENEQRSTYANETGKDISILSIKGNMAA